MSFKMKYIIEQRYLPIKTKRRSGIKHNGIVFLVAHDTGNDGSTANGNVGWYIDTANQDSASAHTFIDDMHIIECVPLDEKAWHVIYNVTTDNNMYGYDANDDAIGVELCFSYQKGNINNAEAYKRYVWYFAYLIDKFNLNPKYISGHNELDPARKSDPYKNALRIMGISKSQFLADVAAELADCRAPQAPVYLFAVYQGNNHLLDYTNYNDAVAYAKQYENSYVMEIATGNWAWTNIPKQSEPAPQPEPVKEEKKVDAQTLEAAKAAIDKLAAEGRLNSPDYWKARLEESLPVWAYMLMEANGGK